jgi:hypothetical protein
MAKMNCLVFIYYLKLVRFGFIDWIITDVAVEVQSSKFPDGVLIWPESNPFHSFHSPHARRDVYVFAAECLPVR